MSRKLRTAALSLCVALMAGCATAPSMHTIQNSRVYSMSYDQTWQNTVAFFASHNIQIKNIAKDSGVIFAEGGTFPNGLADCGSPGLFIVDGRHASFNVFIKRRGNGTEVTVNTEFVETRELSGNRFSVRCSSLGAVEMAVLNAIDG